MWNSLRRYWPPPFLRGRLLTQLLLAYICGLLLALADGAVRPGAWLAGLLTVLAALAARFYRPAVTALLCAALLALGCFMGGQAEKQNSSFPLPPGQEATIYGRVRGSSLPREEGRYRLLLDARQVNGEPWRGQVYLYYEGGPLLSGDMVAARGSVMSINPYGNPGSFDYNAYLKRQGIAASLSCYYGGEVKSWQGFGQADATLNGRLLSAMEQVAGEGSALLQGVFLGDKSELSFSQKSALSFSGALHAFAVSGLHVGYLVGAALLLIGPGRRRRWLRLFGTAALLLFYLHLTGAPASMLRASIMALTLLSAAAWDEKSDALTTLSLAALLCLLYRPLWLGDAGFQLSFASVGGLLYLLPTMRGLLKPKSRQPGLAPAWPLLARVRTLLSETFAVTLAASFGAMPLIGYYFYHISLVGWLVSPLFVLGAGLAVLLCFIAALFALFSAGLATLPLFAADLVMRALMWLSTVSSSWPGAYLASGQTPLGAVLLFYAGLLALPWLAPQRGWIMRRKRFVLLPLFTLVLLLSLAPALERRGNGQLELVFLDVGQGDSALLLTPGGKTVLIDGGGDRNRSGQVGENVLLPYLRYRGLRRLDLLISSHPDADHIDGLFTVLENLPVGGLLYADVFADNALQQRLLELAQAQGTELLPVSAGQSFILEPGLTLTVLHPAAGANYSGQDNNAGCLSFVLSQGGLDFLFTGDASLGDLAYLPQVEIVKLPHHGSKTGYDPDSYARLAAEAVIISVGRDNSYGHPAAEILEYWQGRAALFRTDQNGAITITSDGLSWQARVFWEGTHADIR